MKPFAEIPGKCSRFLVRHYVKALAGRAQILAPTVATFSAMDTFIKGTVRLSALCAGTGVFNSKRRMRYFTVQLSRRLATLCGWARGAKSFVTMVKRHVVVISIRSLG
jgi:hypothetical protein